MEAKIDPTVDARKLMQGIGERARAASRILALASADQKESALRASAAAIRQAAQNIAAANLADIQRAAKAGSSEAFLDRLRLDAVRIEAMAKGLEAIASLADPVGRVLAQWGRPNGLQIERISVPLGVIGIIYESRPNVTADAGALCLKSGNAAILRPGSDSFETSQAIVNSLHAGLNSTRLPEAAIQLVPINDRAIVGEMLTMTEYIDVIIPRGGKSLTKRVLAESKI
ncbi:MAG TPA: aldehyde dehydrogenase family protein, partial [Pyrinomonadaceae bacterium]|nr:aldehyde dehydrogenase family protein [Pyrinomonadaceae bacterium]